MNNKNYTFEVISCGVIFNLKQEILLVFHNSESGSKEFWTLPGGVVEVGENILKALKREVLEETGLYLEKIDGLLYCGQKLNHDKRVNTLIFIYKILPDSDSGNLSINDPDGDISDARWYSKEEAISLLKEIPFRVMSEPIVDTLLKFNTDREVHFWSYEYIESRDKVICTPNFQIEIS